MKTKYTPGPWNIAPNTDAVDIDQKCLGLDPSRSTIPNDIAEHIHSNRGLHIQIRHNKDPQAFAQANELSRLIAAAPEMLEVLKYIVATVSTLDPEMKDGFSWKQLNRVRAAIDHAEGEE